MCSLKYNLFSLGSQCMNLSPCCPPWPSKAPSPWIYKDHAILLSSGWYVNLSLLCPPCLQPVWLKLCPINLMFSMAWNSRGPKPITLYNQQISCTQIWLNKVGRAGWNLCGSHQAEIKNAIKRNCISYELIDLHCATSWWAMQPGVHASAAMQK